jgi:hypothetical protein
MLETKVPGTGGHLTVITLLAVAVGFAVFLVAQKNSMTGKYVSMITG